MNNRFIIFLYAVLAGFMIGIGGIVYLAMENPVVGSFLFSVGLFTVCVFNLNLFTGKVAYVFNNDKKYAFNLIIIWLGNLIGAFFAGSLIKLTRVYTSLKGDITFAQKAIDLCNTKLNDNLLSIFVLAILCNLLIFIAVDSFKNKDHEIAKYLGIIFGVMVFILSGYEHSVADMFYFTAGSVWSIKALLYILVITLGNAVGGVIIPVCEIIKDKYEKQIS